MQFKKVYIEITNKCNLNCWFCKNNLREKRFMSCTEFKTIIKKIKPYTNYVYLHVKGEPLLHPELEEILKICEENKIKVNITTNGTLLKHKLNILEKSDCIRQINVSLHSDNNLSTYFVDIFDACKKLKENIYISYRLWTLKNYQLDKKSTETVDKIMKSYNLSPEVVEKLKKEPQVKIDINTYVNKDNLFSWPTLESKETSHNFCHGLSTHFAILVDGTIVPCCLDGEGNIKLGNIFEDDLQQVLQSERVQKIITGFKDNKCSEKLCLKCSFKNK
jgi:radical SAM protein with 4Fe4S-binding SPASM domain